MCLAQTQPLLLAMFHYDDDDDDDDDDGDRDDDYDDLSDCHLSWHSYECDHAGGGF